MSRTALSERVPSGPVMRYVYVLHCFLRRSLCLWQSRGIDARERRALVRFLVGLTIFPFNLRDGHNVALYTPNGRNAGAVVQTAAVA